MRWVKPFTVTESASFHKSTTPSLEETCTYTLLYSICTPNWLYGRVTLQEKLFYRNLCMLGFNLTLICAFSIRVTFSLPLRSHLSSSQWQGQQSLSPHGTPLSYLSLTNVVSGCWSLHMCLYSLRLIYSCMFLETDRFLHRRSYSENFPKCCRQGCCVPDSSLLEKVSIGMNRWEDIYVVCPQRDFYPVQVKDVRHKRNGKEISQKGN